MAYEDYTIREFKDAWFKGIRSVMNEDTFKIVYSEYVDTSGLFLSEDFEKQGLIYNINSRINYVKMFIRLQKDFIHNFKVPFERDFKNLKNRYGYSLKWKGDLQDFEEQLLNIQRREAKTESFLEGKIKELNTARLKRGEGKQEDTEDTLASSRKNFIRMINSLGKVGYKIDEDKNTVEDLSLMIKQQLEEQEESRKHSKHI